MMSDSKEYQTPSQDHWYVQFKDIMVPEVNYNELGLKDRLVQRMLRFLAPTTSRAYTEKDKYFKDKFREQVRDYSEVRKKIKQLFLVYRSHRLSQLDEIMDRLRLPSPPPQWNDEVDHVPAILVEMDEDSKKVEDGLTKIKPSKLGVSQSLVNNTREYKVMDAVPSAGHLTGAKSQLGTEVIELLDEYCASIKRTRVLRSHLQDVEEDLSNFAHMVNTQATAELTYFRGLRDWCQVMAQLTSNLSSALIAVSTLGAGLIYSTIFGASRGDVGLMCYCFPFFMLGFLLPVVIQILLTWGASLQKEVRFASQPFWTVIIAVFLSISSLSVMASLTITNLTVFFLKRDSVDNPAPDQPESLVPGIIGFGITGVIFILIMFGALLSAIAAKTFTTLKGIRAVVSAMYGGDGGHEDALKVWLPV